MRTMADHDQSFMKHATVAIEMYIVSPVRSCSCDYLHRLTKVEISIP